MMAYTRHTVKCTDTTKQLFNAVELDVGVLYSKIALLRNRLKAGKVHFSDTISNILIAADFYNDDELFVKVDWDDVLLTVMHTTAKSVLDGGNVMLSWCDDGVTHSITWWVDYE
jgi:hypothetical protein